MSEQANNLTTIADAQKIIEQDMVVGVFNTPDQAEHTVQRLIDAGIAPENISVVARDFETKNHVTGFLTTGDVARDMAGTGAWVGGLFGLLAGGTAMLWPRLWGRSWSWVRWSPRRSARSREVLSAA